MSDLTQKIHGTNINHIALNLLNTLKYIQRPDFLQFDVERLKLSLDLLCQDVFLFLIQLAIFPVESIGYV